MQIIDCYHYLKDRQEYIPVVSTLTNGIKLFRYAFFKNEGLFIKKHQYSSLKQKSVARSIVLLIPVVGNVVIALYDFKKQQKADFEFKLLQINGLTLETLSEREKKDEQFVRAAIGQNIKALQYASLRFRDDPDFITEMIRKNPTSFLYAGDTIRNDKRFIFDFMIHYDFSLLQYSHPNLLQDEDFMLGAMKVNIKAIKYSKPLKKNEAFIKKLAAYFNEDFFRYASKDLRKNPIIVNELTEINLAILKKAHPELLLNELFIQEEIIKNSKALLYSPLKSRPDFIAKCMKRDLSILKVADDEIRKDKNFISQFTDKQFRVFKYIDPEVRDDLLTIIEMIQKYNLSLKWLSKSSKLNEDIVLAFIDHAEAKELEFADKSLKNDPEFAKRLVKINAEVLIYLDQSLQKNRQFLLECIKINPECLKFVDEMFQMDEDFIVEAIFKNLKAMQYCPFVNDLQRYELFVLKMIRKELLVINYVDSVLSHDKSFVNKAMFVDRNVLKYLGSDIQNDPDFIYFKY